MRSLSPFLSFILGAVFVWACIPNGKLIPDAGAQSNEQPSFSIYEGDCGESEEAIVTLTAPSDVVMLSGVLIDPTENRLAAFGFYLNLDQNTGEVTSPACSPGRSYRLVVGRR